jgi:Methyltransferase domain
LNEGAGMRDFRQELAQVRCWDPRTEELWQTQGVPADDTILQNREELIRFCEFLERHHVRSYLEIGAWTGRLINLLHKLFDFEKVACCDAGWAPSIGLPFELDPAVDWFKGDSHSQDFKDWRQSLGQIDLVMIDGDHSYEGVKLDFEINRNYPHRFLAFHDIINPHPQIGVGRLWKELEGSKIEFVEPHKEINQDFSTMGIGIWSGTENV